MKLRRQHFVLYPELALFPSDEERVAAIKSLHKQVGRSLWRRPRTWVLFIIYNLFNILSVPVGRSIADRFVVNLPLRIFLSGLPAIMLGIGFAFGFQYLWRAPMQKALRTLLVSKGIPICIPCGYDLRGQIEQRCPECGTPVGQG
jgi:hypothetical protein